jgi:putative tryptophan/tyrosine transport system substrate-binding protein
VGGEQVIIAVFRLVAAVILAFAFIFIPVTFAQGQEAKKGARVGFLDDVSPRDVPWVAAFERRLTELGYVEGRNLVIEFRSAGGRVDRLPDLAAELVRPKPDVIVHLGGPEGARALKQATSTIPIVLAAIEWDPVTTGLVASIARPATNFTGISALAVELAAKRLELLKELVPRASRVAVLWHRPRAADQFRVLQEAAQTRKFNVVSLELGALPHDLEGAFKTASRERADAVLVLGSPAFFPHRKRLAALALRHRLPTSFQRPAYAEAGGLMSYGPDVDDIMRRVADYTDRILKGAVPAELPVEQPSRFELVVNAKTAKALGLIIPPPLLLQADRVIE